MKIFHYDFYLWKYFRMVHKYLLFCFEFEFSFLLEHRKTKKVTSQRKKFPIHLLGIYVIFSNELLPFLLLSKYYHPSIWIEFSCWVHKISKNFTGIYIHAAVLMFLQIRITNPLVIVSPQRNLCPLPEKKNTIVHNTKFGI